MENAPTDERSGKIDVYFEALLLHICMMNCMKIFELRTKCSTMSCERREYRKILLESFPRDAESARVRVRIQCLQCLFIEIETNKDFLEFPLTRCFSFKIIYLPELCSLFPQDVAKETISSVFYSFEHVCSF